MRNSKLILTAIVVVLVGGALIVFSTQQTDTVPLAEENTATTSTEQQEELSPLHVPEGWKVYKTNRISNNLRGVAFSYPPLWEVEDFSRGILGEGGIHIYGDGYDIKVKGHSGFPSDMQMIQQPYILDGIQTRTLQREVNGGYEQVIIIGDSDDDFVIWIDTPRKSTELSDKILSTMRIPK